MASDNRISIQLSETKKANIAAAIAVLKAEFADCTINLTAEEKQSLPRIGDNTFAFDDKCTGYMASREDLIPSFVDMDERAIDRALVAAYLPFWRDLAPLCEAVEDTIMLANSDNMMSDLAFYQNVKQAAKRGVPGADTIYNDLKQRFPGRPRNPSTPPPTP